MSTQPQLIDLGIGQNIHKLPVFIRAFKSGTARTGLFLRFEACQGQVFMPAIFWGANETDVEALNATQYALVSGRIEDYQGQYQIKLTEVHPYQPSDQAEADALTPPPPPRANAAELNDGQLFEGIYACTNLQLGAQKDGKNFLKFMLGDASGTIQARQFGISRELYESLPQNGFALVKGQAQRYNDNMQVLVSHIAPCQPSIEQMRDLVPSTEKDIDAMFTAVTTRLDSLENPQLRALAKAYTDDTMLMDAFKQAPAAMAVHHAFIGGLLEHTDELMAMADALLPLFPKLNRELVLLGLFLHDLGKVTELAWSTGFEYTTEGKLIGHIAGGLVTLEKHCAKAKDEGTEISAPIKIALGHIILSHHGKPEFGAAKSPATPEAVFVSHLDDLSAKMNPILKQAGEREDAFTDRLWFLDNIQMWKADPTQL